MTFVVQIVTFTLKISVRRKNQKRIIIFLNESILTNVWMGLGYGNRLSLGERLAGRSALENPNGQHWLGGWLLICAKSSD